MASGCAEHRGGADGLVGLLGVLGLGLEQARAGGQVVLAVALGDQGADLVQRLLGQVHRVGTHVGDQADGLAADVHAFVELLRHAHGAAGGEAQLARGLLLQGGGGEGRRRVALALLLLHRLDHQLALRRRRSVPARPHGLLPLVMLNWLSFLPCSWVSLARRPAGPSPGRPRWSSIRAA
jgi:hypothetical protein